jgi:hypothetical protein
VGPDCCIEVERAIELLDALNVKLHTTVEIDSTREMAMAYRKPLQNRLLVRGILGEGWDFAHT